jgi:prepilin-type N-terminal cleavage/methylation domain-containing protein
VKATTPPRPRAGLSLVELLVALSVLTLGLLAVAGIGARLVRASTDAATAARAAELLAARAESLAVARCAPAAGARRVDALEERWTLAVGGELLTLVDTVAWSLPGRPPQSVGLTTHRWCEP